jgi:hypothetical protein
MRTRKYAALVVLLVLAASACKETPPKLEGTTPDPSSIPKSVTPPPIAPSGAGGATKPPDEDRFPLSDDEIAAVVNPGKATEYTGPTGVVEGTITVKGDPPSIRTFGNLPKGCAHAGEVHGPAYRAGAKKELADVLVAAIKVAGYVRPSRDDKHVTIKDCAIEPTLIDLSLGQRLMITNADDQPYMPQVPVKMLVRRLAMKGMSPVPVFLTRPSAYALSWLLGGEPNVASTPTATVFVLPNALHAVTGTDGKFRIAGIPAGKAQIFASHVDMPEASKDVEIKAGEVLKVDLVLNYTAKPSTTPSTKPSASASQKWPVIQ